MTMTMDCTLAKEVMLLRSTPIAPLGPLISLQTALTHLTFEQSTLKASEISDHPFL